MNGVTRHGAFFRAEVGTVFALSWLITWFGHVLSDFRHVVRLYDFFLACHPLMPIYFAAVVSSLQNQKKSTVSFHGQTDQRCRLRPAPSPTDCVAQGGGSAGLRVRHGHGSPPAVPDPPGPPVRDAHQPRRRPLRPVPSLRTGQGGGRTREVAHTLCPPPPNTQPHAVARQFRKNRTQICFLLFL